MELQGVQDLELEGEDGEQMVQPAETEGPGHTTEAAMETRLQAGIPDSEPSPRQSSRGCGRQTQGQGG